MNRKIAFVTYESPFARCGGIAAVMQRLPGYVQQACSLPVAVFTPYHHRIASTTCLRPYMKVAGNVIAGGEDIRILRYAPWSHLANPDNPLRLVEAFQHPQAEYTRFLLERMPEDFRRRLALYSGEPASGHCLFKVLQEQLTLLLGDQNLFSAKLLTTEQLTELNTHLKSRNFLSGDYTQLNYALLQLLYPACIPRVSFWPWYFLEACDRDEKVGDDAAQQPAASFSGYPHPYALSSCRRTNAASLLQDALLFGKAVAAALPVLEPLINWILLLQDWEAATTSLALNGHGRQYKQYLVLHNSYDSVMDESSAGSGQSRTTVLTQVIPRITRPLLTVSEQFARDLTSDLFQTRIMAGHLQHLLHTDFIGVDNGPFSVLNVPADIVEEACSGLYRKLKCWKQANQAEALNSLKAVSPGGECPVWGDLQKMQANEAPCWFVMAGRDDPRQKGYDLAAAAVRLFLQEGENALFFFFPIPGDEGLEGLDFLAELATEFPAQVVIFPFHWQAGYIATLRGAGYGIMPSFYEPFGGANEFYLNGTVGLARATGGLIQQIVPLRAAASFSSAAKNQAERWSSSAANPTGLLFREKEGLGSAVTDWEGINRADYELLSGPQDRIGRRMQYATYREIVGELTLCLKDAAAIYTQREELYYRMLRDGILHIQNSFSWQRAGQEYTRHILQDEGQ